MDQNKTNKKTYNEPLLEVEIIDFDDVICTSAVFDVTKWIFEDEDGEEFKL